MLSAETTIINSNQKFSLYFKERLGTVPNVYASMMHSENAMNNYYQFHTRKITLSKKECEAIMLVVSQKNNSLYCLSAHTMIGKLNGFNEAQILDIRLGKATFDKKLDALVKFIKNVIEEKNKTDSGLLQRCFNVGYTHEHLVDALHVVGDGFITNYLTKVLNVPIDFPLAEELSTC